MGDKPGYVIGGDALRGVMMCAVMLVHAAGGLLFTVNPAELSGGAATAFDPFGELIFSLDFSIWTFFALSGYLVGGPYVRAFVEGTRWPHVGRYVSRRARRILPAFWLAIVVLYLVFGSYGATREQMIQTFFFAQGVDATPFEQVFVQGWTVGVEVAFYLALPLVGLLLARWAAGRGTRVSRQAWLTGALLLLAAASLALRTEAADPIGPVARTIVGSVWGFVPGLLLAAYEPDFRAKLAGTARGKAIGAGSLVLFVVSFGIYWQTFSRPGTLAGELLTVVIATSFIVALLTCQWAWGRMPRIIDSRPMHALGRWSFGFYLLHVAIIRELLVRLPDGMTNLEALAYVSSVTLVVGLSLAALSWWLIEEPFIEKRLPRLPWRTVPEATAPPQPPREDPAVAKVPA